MQMSALETPQNESVTVTGVQVKLHVKKLKALSLNGRRLLMQLRRILKTVEILVKAQKLTQ